MIYYISLLLNNFCILLLSGGDGHEKPSLLSVNPGLIIWTIIIFVLLLLLLWKVAWGPLIKALHNREETIKTSLENAEKQTGIIGAKQKDTCRSYVTGSEDYK